MKALLLPTVQQGGRKLTWTLLWHHAVRAWSCPALCNPMACSPPGSSVYSLQPARLLCPSVFSRQEYWDELSFSLPGDLPNPGIEPVSTSSSVVAGGFFTTEPPGKPSLALDNTKSITPAWHRLFPASNHMHTPGDPNVHQNSITSFGKEAERHPGLWPRNI